MKIRIAAVFTKTPADDGLHCPEVGDGASATTEMEALAELDAVAVVVLVACTEVDPWAVVLVVDLVAAGSVAVL